MTLPPFPAQIELSVAFIAQKTHYFSHLWMVVYIAINKILKEKKIVYVV